MQTRDDRIQEWQTLIGGSWQGAADGRTFDSLDPYTGQVWARLPRCGAAEVDLAVTAARAALEQGPWATIHPSARGALLRRLGDLITRDADRLALAEVRDNGKLWAEMRGQCGYLAQWFHYFGGLADKIEGAVLPIDKPEMFTYTRHEPVGVVAAITPWNSPLLLLVWKMAPALAAGCTMVIKPSEFTSVSTLELMKLVDEAGFPPGVVNVVTGFGPDCGAALTAHPGVDKIAFTGGDASGRQIGRIAADGLKRITLELGGKSAQVIFPDANLDNAVKGVVSGIFAASGQTCIAGSRVIVHDSLHDEFVAKFLDLARTARLGDPLDPATQVGPVTTPVQYQRILDCIAMAERDGARCILGGKPAALGGLFIEPTVFDGVTADMEIARTEVFGPVLSILTFRTEDEAWDLANATPYGLAAGVWTQDQRRQFTAARKLQAGMIWTNCYRAVSYMAPFGGVKSSGIGRESGQDAIYDYLETKTVWVDYGPAQANPFVLR